MILKSVRSLFSKEKTNVAPLQVTLPPLPATSDRGVGDILVAGQFLKSLGYDVKFPDQVISHPYFGLRK